MADSAVPVTGGTGYNVDTRTESINGDHRQVMVLGDPVTGANVTTVDSSGRANVAASGFSITMPASTNITAAAATYTGSVGAAGNVTFWLSGSNTSTGAAVTVANVVFEQSADTFTWSPLLMVRSDTSAAVSTFAGTITSGSSIAFDAALEGVAYARVRTVTAASSGTCYCVGISGGMPFSPVVTVGNTPVVTKGTQGSNGFTVQDLKDAGRSIVTWACTATAGVTTEALIGTATVWRAGTVVGTAGSASTLTVTTGKTLRINNISASVRQSSGTATTAWSRLTLRYIPSGTASATSPIGWAVELGPASAQNSVDRFSADFPDGIEIPGGGSFAISHITSATTNLHTVTVTAFEY